MRAFVINIRFVSSFAFVLRHFLSQRENRADRLNFSTVAKGQELAICDQRAI